MEFQLLTAKNLPTKNFRPPKSSAAVNYDVASAAKQKAMDPTKAFAEKERQS